MVRALVDGKKTQTRRLGTSPLARCNPGDRLWVREAFAHEADEYEWSASTSVPARVGGTWYMADGVVAGGKWRPSIHMPRALSRLTLHVTDVRMQSLQEISEEDAKAEGAPRLGVDDMGVFYEVPNGTHRTGFAGLWDHLHGSGAWDANPLVVALTFRVERRNIDA